MTTIKITSRLLVPGLLLAMVSLTFLIYSSGLSGDFIFDDFINIVNNTDSHLSGFTYPEISQVLFSGVASEISRPLSMLSFGINYYFTNLDPFYFKLTNLIIHIIITFGLYYLSTLLLQLRPDQKIQKARNIHYVALIVAGCWALHPLNVSSVLYVVQRMNQLSVLITVYTLIYYCSFRMKESPTSFQAVTAFTVVLAMLIIGILFKENAALLALYILTIEIFLLQFRSDSGAQRLFIKLILVFLILIPGILALLALAISPTSLLGDYDVRSFTLVERLLTQARVIWIYISWLLIPDTRELVFFYDNYPASKSLFDPITTLFAVLGVLALLYFCWQQRKRWPYLSFGIAFFLAGHALESTIVALELMFEHRNYLPGFGLLFGCVHTLLNLPANILSRKVAAGFLGVFLVFIALGTAAESKKWSNTHSHLVSIATFNPGSYRIYYSLGYLYLTLASRTPDNAELFSLASHFFLLATQLNEKAVNAHAGVMLADSQNGKPIDPAIIIELEKRLRHNALDKQALTEISMLTECWYGNFCKFDKAVLFTFFNAIAQNQASPAIAKQAFLDQFGTAIAYRYGNKADGRALLYLAKAQRAELTIVDLKLIQLEIELQGFTRARNLLAEARQKPMTAFFENALEEFDDKLSATLSVE